MEQKNCYILTNNLGEYRNKEFNGYCWMSDRTIPELVDGQFTLPIPGSNPFVAEANLYSQDGKVSISILHNDGLYLVGIVIWDEVEEKVKKNFMETEDKIYLTNRIDKLKGAEKLHKIKFVRAWIPVEDPFCENMEVLQPAWRAFKGFIVGNHTIADNHHS